METKTPKWAERAPSGLERWLRPGSQVCLRDTNHPMPPSLRPLHGERRGATGLVLSKTKTKTRRSSGTESEHRYNHFFLHKPSGGWSPLFPATDSLFG